MKELNNTYYVCDNLLEFQQVFLVLSTYFTRKTIEIYSFSSYPIIFIKDNEIHGAKREPDLIRSYPKLNKKVIKAFLKAY